VRNCGPVLIVDDDAGIRELISTLLRRAGFETCMAASPAEALRLAERNCPSVALVDVDLGGGASGYELCRELRDRLGNIAVVFVSGARTEPYDRVGGLLIGADDYIVKPFEPDELIARTRQIAARGRSTAGTEEAVVSESLRTLTAREDEVLQLLAVGLSQRDIAEKLVLSPKTIATHIQNILSKLELHSRAAAVAFAHREGLVEDVSAHALTVSAQ
jgi:DNA-binding NarL/FixJ family response regulator